jgi:hypothetical protein
LKPYSGENKLGAETMLRFTTLVPVLALAISGSLFATTITSTFDVDLDGWTAQHGVLVYNASGGNPGGYLEEDDDGQSNMQADAPAKFIIGDLTGYSISVDLNVLGTLPTNPFGGFGKLTLYNGAASMTADLGDPAIGWTHYSTALTLTAFGNDANFNTIITNVTKIQIALDPVNQQSGDATGMDNFTLSNTDADSPVPEPATLGIAGLALIAVAVVRRTAR